MRDDVIEDGDDDYYINEFDNQIYLIYIFNILCMNINFLFL